MIGNLRKFASTKFAGILVGIIIIPFVFMGMGSVFKSGNTNNIAKINNTSISTQQFMDYLNQTGLSQQVIKDNINKNILEELLSTLVSTTLLDLEIKNLKLEISEETLVKNIRKNKKFQDKNGKFKRTLYEKFLLSNNMTAPIYELKLKNITLQKQLFTYISGGTKSPKFLTNKYYEERNKKLDIDYINLDKFYKKKDTFTDQEIKFFINQNLENLKQDYIDFSYVVITPKKLTGLDEYSQSFFDKIDNIENEISKNVDFKTIVDGLDIEAASKKNYINLENKETIENKIYNSRNNKIEILEDKNSYIFYQIDKINTKLPDLNNGKFKTQIKNLLFQKQKFEFNKNILDQINKKQFNQTSFNKLGKEGVKKIRLNSIKDDKKFEINSIEILYSLPIDTFTLIADDKDNVFIAKTVNYEEQSISAKSKKFNGVSNEASTQNRNGILKSYDYLLGDKYEVIVNEKTLDRVKNYFK
jgi:peptidyl-prolyl cis-trans isomerase D